MKTYVVYVDYSIPRKRAPFLTHKSKRFVVEANDILSASAKCIAKIKDSLTPPAVSMIWPVDLV